MLGLLDGYLHDSCSLGTPHLPAAGWEGHIPGRRLGPAEQASHWDSSGRSGNMRESREHFSQHLS
jgi:hypothetical protein